MITAPPLPTPLLRLSAVREQIKMRGFGEDHLRATLEKYRTMGVWSVCPVGGARGWPVSSLFGSRMEI